VKRSSWLDVMADQADLVGALTAGARQFLTKLDDVLFSAWNLGDNIGRWTG
jgi:hypothetical protein